jgi:hypothetical protein
LNRLYKLRRYQIKILGIALLSVLLLFGLVPVLTTGTNVSLLNNSNLHSADDLAIVYPTGTIPGATTGYYPATFGFENDVSWSTTDPEGWYTYEVPTGTYARAYDDSSYQVHRKMLALYDNSAQNYALAMQTFGEGIEYVTDPTVELWVMTHLASYPTTIIIDSPDDFLQMTIAIAGNYLWYYDSSETPHSAGYYISNSEWYHLSIEFDYWREDHLYLGPPIPPGFPTGYLLDCYRYTVDVTHDGNTQEDVIDYTASKRLNYDPDWGWPPFNAPEFSWDYVTRLWFCTQGAYANQWYWAYFDAVGYSWDNDWDNDYTIGDNLNLGMPLLFNDIGKTGTAYSLDSGTTYSILGNCTLPMPGAGDHSIEVFADGHTSATSDFHV